MLACVAQNAARQPFSGRFFLIQVNKQKKVHTASWQQNNFKTNFIKQTKKTPEPRDETVTRIFSVQLHIQQTNEFLLKKEKYNLCMEWGPSPRGTYLGETNSRIIHAM